MDRVDSFTLSPKRLLALGDMPSTSQKSDPFKKQTVALHPLLTGDRSIRRRAQTATWTAAVDSLYIHKSTSITNSKSSRFQALPDRGSSAGQRLDGHDLGASSPAVASHPPARVAESNRSRDARPDWTRIVNEVHLVFPNRLPRNWGRR